ncbi:MAG: hypothetical protein ACTS6P_01245 [Candidatus Hodgkinia cicadicola]
MECYANGKWRLTVDAFPPKLIGINDNRRKWFFLRKCLSFGDLVELRNSLGRLRFDSLPRAFA